ncbi:MAG TPA: hypothetical protein VIT43_01985 [Candidatus Dormibacteraeota bacterium]
MFLRAFVEIRVPASAAARVLRRLPQALVESFAEEAIDHGHTVLAEVGVPLGKGSSSEQGESTIRCRLGKQVQIELGDAVEVPSRTWLPVTWKPTSAGTFFPALEGELEVAPLGRDVTQIGLSARYKPPFGVLGTTLDRMFLHRVAEATVQDFVQRVAAAIQSQSRVTSS